MHDVFISFSSKEEGAAEFVRNILETNMITCWKAPQDIPPGSDYANAIPEAIAGCRIFLLMLSEESQKSPWVRRELDMAVNCGKLIIPFVMEDCQLNEAFNFILSNVQRYNAYQKNAEAMEELVRQIYAVTRKSSDPTKEPNAITQNSLPDEKLSKIVQVETQDEESAETVQEEPPDEELAETVQESIQEQDPDVKNVATTPVCCPTCGSDQVARIGFARKLGAGMAAGIGATLLMPALWPVAVAAGAYAVKIRYRCKDCKTEFKSVVPGKPNQTAKSVSEESDLK